MLSRQDLEEREENTLAPYAAKSKLTQGRQYPEPEHPFRTVYQRDRDRVIHSTAFRRLEYKTQVFVNHEGDHYRTRLTHTIEVTQIARTIARALNLNEDLTEAIALAHDVGHTPFGHAGEETLYNLMKEHGGFEHNSHGVRVVELLEQRYPHFPGINLSWEVRESMIKHKTAYDQPQINKTFHPEWQPLLEAQVVDAADTIAYDNHDLDDGIRAGLIGESELSHLELWKRACIENKAQLDTDNPSIFRSQVIIYIINMEITDLINNTLKSLEKGGIKSVEDVRKYSRPSSAVPKLRSGEGQRLVGFSPEISRQKQELQRFLLEHFYTHPVIIRMTKKSRHFIEDIFNTYVNDTKQLPLRYQKRIPAEDKYRVICDYLAGMTDRYLQEEYQKLFYPFEKM